MRLFDSKKDWILKLTNLVLLVWLISAITFFHIAVVDILIPEPLMEYKEYELINCGKINEENDYAQNCLNQYENEKLYNRDLERRQQKSIFTSFGNIVIVTLGIYLLNKEKK